MDELNIETSALTGKRTCIETNEWKGRTALRHRDKWTEEEGNRNAES